MLCVFIVCSSLLLDSMLLFGCIMVYLLICLVTDYRFLYAHKFSFYLGNTYEGDYLVLR